MGETHQVVSFAQNAEDIVLLRAFGHLETGFYVDVGAGHPTYDSVTKVFYDRGWRGINIEPCRAVFEELKRERPADVNLNVGLAERSGLLPFFEFADRPGSSTFDQGIAQSCENGALRIDSRDVQVISLRDVCRDFVREEIDFLKIDVEGFEAKVINGADWKKWRPRVLVVEATYPGETTPVHSGWEPVLLQNGYHFCLFDGINRFFVREEDSDLADLLGVPANFFDGFVPYRYKQTVLALQSELGAANKEHQKAHDHIVTVEAEITRLKDDIAGSEDQMERLRTVIQKFEQQVAEAESYSRLLEDEFSRKKNVNCRITQELTRVDAYVTSLEMEIDDLRKDIQSG